MRHHAYFYAGDLEEGITASRAFAKQHLGLSGEAHPDIVVLRHALFSVDDARLIATLASRAPVEGDAKIIVISAGRIFHEAQNALLKTFEEPSHGTVLVLIVPSEGNLIETLRSRVLPLPVSQKEKGTPSPYAAQFLAGNQQEREKLIEGILNRAKSDDATEKQEARLEALRFTEGLAIAAYEAKNVKPSRELTLFLSDVSRLIPILHERSAPLKPILEHLLIIAPHTKHLKIG